VLMLIAMEKFISLDCIENNAIVTS